MISRALTGGGVCLYVGMFILLHTASRGRYSLCVPSHGVVKAGLGVRVCVCFVFFSKI